MVEPPKRGRPTTVEREERRARMLDVALPVFLEHGFERATVDQLARAAGVTKRTIYTDYGDKSGLFSAMVQQLAGTISHEGDADDDTVLSLSTRIVHRVMADDLIGLHRLVIGEARRFPQLARAFHERADQRHILALRIHLSREHGADAAGCAEWLFSLLLGEWHRRRLLGLTPAPTEAEAAEHARTAIRSLGFDTA